jgi:hypothetical protein
MTDLKEAIHQQISLGHRHPHEFYDLLKRQLGDELLTISKPYLADFINEMARHEIGNERRSAVAKINDKTLETGEVKLKSLWVPAKGEIIYKRIADMTAKDFDARADYLDRMTRGIQRHAEWCRTCATNIRKAKVKTAGELLHLPSLPDADRP